MSRKPQKLKALKVEDITLKDSVIAVMGPTGVGKSTFIDTATNQGGAGIGHSLHSCTADIRAVRVPGSNIVLVDTPGFDDTEKSDTEILKLIASWLEKTYKNKIKLSGIVYLHRISDNRMAGTPLKNLHMFANLCGDDAVRNVILTTTMWSRVKAEVGSQREKELRGKYWKPMLDLGSGTHRFLGTHESAWSIINVFREKDQNDTLLLQEEMVDLEKRLSETQAGKTLYSELQKLLADQRDIVRSLRDDAEHQQNEALAKELREEYERIQDQLRRTFDQIQEIKIPLGRRILLIFSFKRSRANAWKVVE